MHKKISALSTILAVTATGITPMHEPRGAGLIPLWPESAETSAKPKVERDGDRASRPARVANRRAKKRRGW